MPIDRLSDLHMHTAYSDGKGSAEEMILSAIDKGMKKIAITDHMPLPFPDPCAVDMDRLNDYRAEVKRLKYEYEMQIDVQLGLEIDFIPQLQPWIQDIVDLGWDYLITSVHFLFGKVEGKPQIFDSSQIDPFVKLLRENYQGDAQTMCEEFYKTVQKGAAMIPGSTIGHFDRIKLHNRGNNYFEETSTSYRKLVEETLIAVQAARCRIEINTSGFDRAVKDCYPSLWIIELCKSMNIPIVLGSDSHHPSEIGRYFDRF